MNLSQSLRLLGMLTDTVDEQRHVIEHLRQELAQKRCTSECCVPAAAVEAADE